MNKKLKIGLFITGGLAVVATGIILYVKFGKQGASKSSAAGVPKKKTPPAGYKLINTQDGTYYYVHPSELDSGGYANTTDSFGPFWTLSDEDQKSWLKSKGYPPMSDFT